MAHMASKKNLSICFESNKPSSEQTNKQKQKKTFISRFLHYRRDGDARQFAKRARNVCGSIKNGFNRAEWTSDELTDLAAFARVSGLDGGTTGDAIKMDGLATFVTEKYKSFHHDS